MFRVLLPLALAAAVVQADEVAGHVAALAKGDTRARIQAAKALARVDREEAHAALERALDDKAPAVRALAGAALVKRFPRHKRARSELAGLLASGDWYAGWQACLALRGLGARAKDAIPALLNAAGDPKLDLAQEAIGALLVIAPADPSVLHACAQILDSEAKVDRTRLVAHLAAHKRLADAQPWLAKEFASNEHGLRREAYRWLLRRGASARDTFAAVLADGPPPARVLAARGLGTILQKEAAVALADGVDDPDPAVRSAVATSLGEMAKAASVATPPLVTLLTDADRTVVLAAVQALGELGAASNDAEPHLIRLVARPDAAIARAAVAALTEYKTSAGRFLAPRWETVRDGAKARREWRVRLAIPADDEVPFEAIFARLESNDAGPALVTALRDTLAPEAEADLRLLVLSEKAAPTVRGAAAEFLVSLARDRAAARAAIEKASRDRRARVRDAMLAALERLGDE